MSGRKNTENDFWKRVNIKSENECWEWKANIRSDGYGRFHWNDNQIGSHRMAWIFTYGEIPDGLQVLHDPEKCSNPRCCNPKHLRIGTHLENHHDSDVTKLNWDKVRFIRDQYRAKIKNIYELAKEFGVTPSNISCVVRDKTWIE